MVPNSLYCNARILQIKCAAKTNGDGDLENPQCAPHSWRLRRLALRRSRSGFGRGRLRQSGAKPLLPYTTPPSNGSSTRALTPRGARPPIFGGRFGLRCFQPLSAWGVATRRRPCGRPVHQRPRHPVPFVLRVPSPQAALQPQQGETELARDVLNPAHVPL